MGLIDGIWNKLLGDPAKPGSKGSPATKAKAGARAGDQGAPAGAARVGGQGLLPASASTGAEKAAADGKTAADSAALRQQALAQVRAGQERMMTPERQALIQQAMAVHRAKQKILDNLTDEQRQKLVAIAVKNLLNEGRETKD